MLEYLKSLRRENPNATAAEILTVLEKRYVATVTITSTGVGASAAIPAVGIPLALGLGVADLLFFYETSALYVLATAELHGIDDQRRGSRGAYAIGSLFTGNSSNARSSIVDSVSRSVISRWQRS